MSLSAADLRYVFGRLDMDHVRQCAHIANLAWRAPGMSAVQFEICLMPGDGTHYGLLVVPLNHVALGAPGGGTGGNEPSSALVYPRDGHAALVYYAQAGRGVIVNVGEFVHPDWLAGHLPETAPASVVVLAVFLNLMTGAGEEWMRLVVDRAEEAEAEVNA